MASAFLVSHTLEVVQISDGPHDLGLSRTLGQKVQ